MLKKLKNWWNAPNRAPITFKNVWSVIQSFYRRNDYDTPGYIIEQVEERKLLGRKECVESNVCICGCAFDELIWADKQCEGKCYPVMKSEKEWKEFKKQNDKR